MKTLPAYDVYLSLGSNIGDRLAHLQAAMHELGQTPSIDIIKVSSVYETEPWGLHGQRPFFNAVVLIHTSLSAMDLLRLCQKIEQQQLRVCGIRWGPRTLDIDILRYGNMILNNLELTIPHPRMEERDFVMVPLNEVEYGLLEERPGIRRIAGNWYPVEGYPETFL